MAYSPPFARLSWSRHVPAKFAARQPVRQPVHRKDESTLCAHLPQIVMNFYVKPETILAGQRLPEWMAANPHWSDGIRDHALDETKLPAAIAALIGAMRLYAREI